MSTILALLVAGIAFVAWYVLRGRGAGPRASALPKHKAKVKAAVKANKAAAMLDMPKNEPRKSRRRRSFKGAGINPGPDCCAAATALTSKRFLVEQAPRLPLEGCDRVATCSCKYHNFADRRQDDERRNVYGALSTVGQIGSQGNNKRSGMDRRQSLDTDLDRIEVE